MSTDMFPDSFLEYVYAFNRRMHGDWIKSEQRYEDGCKSGASDHPENIYRPDVEVPGMTKEF